MLAQTIAEYGILEAVVSGASALVTQFEATTGLSTDVLGLVSGLGIAWLLLKMFRGRR